MLILALLTVCQRLDSEIDIAGDEKDAELFENGASSSYESVVFDNAKFSELLRRYRCYSATGTERGTFSSVIPGERLWRVPKKKQFMWPTFEVGHRVNVSLAPNLKVELETLAKSPRVFRVRGFLSHGEVTTLTETMLNNKTLSRSTTFTGTVSRDRESYGDINRLRTSDNAWDEDSILSLDLQHRAHLLTKVLPRAGDAAKPNGYADGLQLLRYQQGQAYHIHTDWLGPDPNENTPGNRLSMIDEQTGFDWDSTAEGSNRFATLFIYLSDVEAGGQTVFPHAPPVPGAGVPPEAFRGERDLAASLFERDSWESSMVDQCFTRLAVRPKRGDTLLFYNQLPNGAVDPASEHGGCPVLRGTKYAVNLWLWSGRTYQESQRATLTFVNELPIAQSWQPVKLFFQVPSAGPHPVEWDAMGPDERKTTVTWQGHAWHFECAAMRSRAWNIHIGRDGGRQTLVLTKRGLLLRTGEGADLDLNDVIGRQGRIFHKKGDEGHFERIDEREQDNTEDDGKHEREGESEDVREDEREDERDDEKEL